MGKRLRHYIDEYLLAKKTGHDLALTAEKGDYTYDFYLSKATEISIEAQEHCNGVDLTSFTEEELEFYVR